MKKKINQDRVRKAVLSLRSKERRDDKEVRSVPGNGKGSLGKGGGEVMGRSSDQECEPCHGR